MKRENRNPVKKVCAGVKSFLRQLICECKDRFAYCDKNTIFKRILTLVAFILCCFLSYSFGSIRAHEEIDKLFTKEKNRLEQTIRQSELKENQKRNFIESYKKRQIERGEEPSDEFEILFIYESLINDECYRPR